MFSFVFVFVFVFLLLLFLREGEEGTEGEKEKDNSSGPVYNVTVLKSLFNISEFLKKDRVI